ncbi:hypothetical protein PG999_000101 [Apiospora kogelbergensis]|uniref:F-box domain-containing protein n=1 Tax=Apiospora kogelbergensis TaxID=1337665 RepID=A0AAW0RAS4_9PEZI
MDQAPHQEDRNMSEDKQTIAPGASQEEDMAADAHDLTTALVLSETNTMFENLWRMPNELFDKIVGCLDLKDQVKLSVTCKALLARVKPVMDDFVWNPPVPLYKMGRNGRMYPKYVRLAEMVAQNGHVACPWCSSIHSPMRSMEPNSGFECAKYGLTLYNGYRIRGIHPLVIYAIQRRVMQERGINHLMDSAEEASFEDSDDIRRKRPVVRVGEVEDHPQSFDKWLYSRNILNFQWSSKINWVPGRGLFVQQRYSVLCPLSGWRFSWRRRWRDMALSFWMYLWRLSQFLSLALFRAFLARHFPRYEPRYDHYICGCGKYCLHSYPLLLKDLERVGLYLIDKEVGALTPPVISAADIRSRKLAISQVLFCQACRSEFQVAVRKVTVKPEGSNSNSKGSEACWVHYTTWTHLGEGPMSIEQFYARRNADHTLHGYENETRIIAELCRGPGTEVSAGNVRRLSCLFTSY